jgi:TRAP transporter 4TM/12TM fusion protein
MASFDLNCGVNYFLALNYSPERAVFWALIVTIVVSAPRKHTRMSGNDLLDALRDGAVGSVEVAAACAAAGIIIGCITVTGLGLKFSQLIIDLSGGHLLFALPLTMLACLALGMGVPTTAQYIIFPRLRAPALLHLGVEAIAAHLFIFYFGTRADITPPVALAAYAGAGIAGSNPMKTGYAAFQLGLACYLGPFMCVYGPELLIIPSSSVFKIVLATTTAIIGVYCLAAAVQNCLFIKTTRYERLILFVWPFC